MANRYRAAAVKAARSERIPVPIFLKLIQFESGWQPGVTSSAGAQGLTQLMPATAASLGVTDPFDPVQNLGGGARYLKQQYDRFGTWRLALAAYNAGPGRVTSGEWKRIPSTVRYVNGIMSGYTAPKPTKSGGVPGKPQPEKTADQQPTGSTTKTTVTTKKTTGNPSAPDTPDFTEVPVLNHDVIFGTDAVSKAAFDSLGKIAQGWDPTDTLQGVVDAATAPVQTMRVPTATPQPVKPVTTTTTTTTTEEGKPGGKPRDYTPAKPSRTATQPAEAGVPVTHLSSESPEHPTSRLAGYPAHDYFAPTGSPAVAPVSGKVIKLSGRDQSEGPSGPHGALGWSVYIQAPDGTIYYLTHLGQRTVRLGQTLKQGQQIGTVANWKKYGLPSHIHMGVHRP